MKHIAEEDESNAHVKRICMHYPYQLHELSLQLYLLYNENIMWKETQGKPKSIYYSLNRSKNIEGNIRILSKAYFYEIEQDLHY